MVASRTIEVTIKVEIEIPIGLAETDVQARSVAMQRWHDSGEVTSCEARLIRENLHVNNRKAIMTRQKFSTGRQPRIIATKQEGS